MKKGIWNAVGAYFLWGILPIYWKLLAPVSALQILGHRVVWSLLTLIVLITVKRNWQEFRRVALSSRVLWIYSGISLLLGINWLTYIWGVNAGQIVETSLGYFINPLISVLFGVLFLREHLRPLQWASIGLAIVAVIYLTVAHGSLPWIALTLAVTFGLYGLLKKTAPLGALHGLTVETGVLFLPSLVYLFFIQVQGKSAFGRTGFIPDLLLVGSGIITTLPLLMFARAARSIPLWMVGLLQYIAPTMQFLIGVLVYDEAFTLERAIGFVIIWVALGLFWLEGVLWRRKSVTSLATG